MNIDNKIIRASAMFTEGHFADALRIYDEGMKAGNTRAIFNYAYCLQYGYGTDPDPARAFELYTYLRYEEAKRSVTFLIYSAVITLSPNR